jgi:hypothetical protein
VAQSRHASGSEAIFRGMMKTIRREERISICGYGSFSKYTGAKHARHNPQTEESCAIHSGQVNLDRIIQHHPIASNRLVWAALAGTLVWFADQPTVDGYNPLFEMFWDPGFCWIPNWDRGTLLLSWLITTLFCHFVLFAFQRCGNVDETSGPDMTPSISESRGRTTRRPGSSIVDATLRTQVWLAVTQRFLARR